MSMEARISVLLDDISPDGVARRVGDFINRNLQRCPDRDLTPRPNTDREVIRRFGLVWHQLMAGVWDDPKMDPDFREGMARMLLGRSRFRRDVDYREDGGWIGAIMEGRRNLKGGLPIVYREMADLLIYDQSKNYIVLRIRETLPTFADFEEVQAVWTVLKRKFGAAAKSVGPSGEAEFYMNREKFLEKFAGTMVELGKIMDPSSIV